jgi:integral membrane protein (TIGR01906 family)
LFQALSWIVALLVPVILVLTFVRLILFHPFLTFEYNTPNFPGDPYGFTKDERLYWSRIAMDYLTNSAGISFISDLRFGDGSPVYNERELRHFVDAKNAVQGSLRVWRISLILLVVLSLWAWRGGWLKEFRTGLSRGGWLTTILLAVTLLFVLFGFDTFFVAFHNVFFPPGTWMFLWSDTFIRLFPERLWRDIFIYVGVLAGAAGLALGFGFRSRRKAS